MKENGKRVVVIGSSGRLGKSLVKALQASHQVVAFNRQELNLALPDTIEQALAPLHYDHLFLAGALTGVDYCETHHQEAFTVNGASPGEIARISAAKGAHVTYISTDFVFDGGKPEPYGETDEPNPISVYGASKLEGENGVLAASAGNLVARVSWVFGPGRPAFPEWIIGEARAKTDLTLPDNKIGSPTYTMDLIQWLETLVFNGADGPASGIYHLCNSDPCTWRDWGQYSIDSALAAGVPVIAGEIRGVPLDSVAAFVARRPVNSAMSTEKFRNRTGVRPRGWREALREFVMECAGVQP